jgi:hypothetical protein
MGKRIAILQSNYIPWKGYFDLINFVDEFIIYDTAQFTKNDWRNRNKIKTPNGQLWLSIPVVHNFGQLIQDVVISDPTWSRKHWNSLSQNYAKAACFKFYKSRFEKLYRDCSGETRLSNINYRFMMEICEVLSIKTPVTWSSDYRLVEGRTERLVDLCKQAGADEYLSGPAARSYIDATRFAEAGIKLIYIDYSGYPEYPQIHPPFEHGVSIVDLIFNTGPEAPGYMKSFVGSAGGRKSISSGAQ